VEAQILIVDDEADVLEPIKKRLLKEGFAVITAKNGEEAIVKAKAYLPKLIFLDIMLPDIDGADVAKVLKNEKTTENIPIVFLSGIAAKGAGGENSGILVDGRRFNAITKPFSFEELMVEIKKVL